MIGAVAPPLPDLDGAPAAEILGWALAEFSPRLAVACSMQDAVVVDLAVRLDPTVEVFFLDTGFHFAETYRTAARLERRYALNLVRLVPDAGPAVYDRDGAEACCAARKLAPMARYLAGKQAWVTGLRRAESSTRGGARAVEWDARHGLVKVNPIVAWSDDDVARHIAAHDLIVNPLLGRGYDSIGCAPCTLPGRGREGRWAGTSRTECGLHGG
ncbi:MAG: phosphoadenosine phosphosulfate reductase [Actinomycetota bacterium]|nr:phosphoadenosine phosphosulfate reductase [Actinomycetota bacterium]